LYLCCAHSPWFGLKLIDQESPSDGREIRPTAESKKLASTTPKSSINMQRKITPQEKPLFMRQPSASYSYELQLDASGAPQILQATLHPYWYAEYGFVLIAGAIVASAVLSRNSGGGYC